MITYRVLGGTTDFSVVIRIVDSTDGTPETGVVFNTAGIDLQYRRELAASTAITEATLAALTTAHADGGFLHIGNGYYRLDLPDAAVATGVKGCLVHGTVTGMVVIGCYIEILGYDQTAALATPTNITAGTITTVTNLTNAPTAGDLTATMKASVTAAVPTAAVIADAVLDEDMTAHQTQGSLGQAIGDPVADTNTIFKAVVTDAAGANIGVDIVAVKAETAAILVDTGTTLDAALAVVDANVDAILVDTAEIGAAGAGLTNINLPNQTMDIVGNITGNLSGSVGSVTGAVGSVTAGVTLAASAIQAIWDALTSALTTAGSIGKFLTDTIFANYNAIAALPTAAAIADSVWDETLADHLGAGSTGNALNAAGAAGDPWSTAIPGAYGAGTAGKIVGDNINATISSRASQTSVDDIPTNAELTTALGTADDATLAAIAALNNLSQANIRTAVGLGSANLDTQLADLPTNAELTTALADLPTNAELATALGTADDAVLAAVAALNNIAAGAAMTLTSAERNAIADALFARSLGTEAVSADGAVPTLAEALFEMLSSLGEFSIAGTTITCKKRDGTTTLFTSTLDSAVTPTSRTRAT